MRWLFLLMLAGAAEAQSFTDDFSTGVLNTQKWAIDGGASPNSPGNVGTFSSSNVNLSPGMLGLRLDQTCAQSGCTSIGAEVRTVARYGYGTYSWTAKVANVSGTVNGLFLYFGGTNTAPSYTEIDFEVEGQSPGLLELTSWLDPTPPGMLTTTQPETGMDTAFHTYMLIWQAGQIDYYFDGSLVSTHTTNVPTNPAYAHMNIWGTNSVDYGGPGTDGTRWLWIKKFSYSPSTVAPPSNLQLSVH